MSRYRRIEVRLWIDERFRELSPPQPSGQFLWLYLLSGPRTTTYPGLVVAREAVMADDLGWSIEGFREVFSELEDRGMVCADWRTGVVILPRGLQDSSGEPRSAAKPESPNVIRKWAKSWDDIPDSPLKDEYLRLLASFAEALGGHYRKAFLQAFSKAMGKASIKASIKATPQPPPNQDQEQDQEQNLFPEEEGARAGSGFSGSLPLSPEPPDRGLPIEHVQAAPPGSVLEAELVSAPAQPAHGSEAPPGSRSVLWSVVPPEPLTQEGRRLVGKLYSRFMNAHNALIGELEVDARPIPATSSTEAGPEADLVRRVREHAGDLLAFESAADHELTCRLNEAKRTGKLNRLRSMWHESHWGFWQSRSVEESKRGDLGLMRRPALAAGHGISPRLIALATGEDSA